MNIKKYIVYATLVATMLVGAGSMALAEDSNTSSPSSYPKPMIIEINSSGKILLRGTITAVGTSSLTVKSWGGNWIINILTDTKIVPGDTISQFTVGDFVGVHGQVKEGVDWTVDATYVRDWSLKQEWQTVKKEIRELKKSVDARNWQGTASNINTTTNSLTLTIDGTAYTVNVVADAKIVNRNYSLISLSDIMSGHTVRVWGSATDTTITAYVVRNTSIP